MVVDSFDSRGSEQTYNRSPPHSISHLVSAGDDKPDRVRLTLISSSWVEQRLKVKCCPLAD